MHVYVDAHKITCCFVNLSLSVVHVCVINLHILLCVVPLALGQSEDNPGACDTLLKNLGKIGRSFTTRYSKACCAHLL